MWCLFLTASALADPLPPIDPQAPGEVVIVEGEAAVQEAYEAAIAALGDLGYHVVRTRHDRVVLQNEVGWKPVVTLYDWGGVSVHSRRIVGNQITNKRQQRWHEQWIIDDMHPGRKGAERIAEALEGAIQGYLSEHPARSR